MKIVRECLRIMLIILKMSLPFVNLTFKDKAFILYHRYLVILDEIKFSRHPHDVWRGSRMARVVTYLEKREERKTV